MNVYKSLRHGYKNETGKNLSLRALAKEIGITPSHISEIENDVKRPSLNEMIKYKEFFGVSLEYLMGEDPEGIVADKEDVKFAMKSVQKADTSEEILLKQTVEMLFGTNPGKAILYQISEILFGLLKPDAEAGSYVKDETNNELHRITHDTIEERANILVNELIVLRDPKYRKASYNEIMLIMDNLKNNNEADTFSGKCLTV